jgi:hypothetical protein
MRGYSQYGLKRGRRHFGSDAGAKPWENFSYLTVNIRLRVNTQKSGAQKFKKPWRSFRPQTKWRHLPFWHRLRPASVQSQLISVGLGRKEILLGIFAGMAYENVYKDWTAWGMG